MNPSGLLAAGVDLGGTNVRAAVVDPTGQILGQSRARIDSDLSPEAVVRETAALVREVATQAGTSVEELRAVGVGAAAQMRGTSGVVALAPNLGWRDVPFGPLLAEALGRPVQVVNDLDAIAWGEACFGAARGHQQVLVVFLGTGVGGGLVLGGRPYHGASGVAGEIGHVKVRPAGGLLCGCGSRGCLEAYLGGRNLSARLRAEAPSWPALSELVAGRLETLHPGHLEQLCVRGDERAQALVAELGELLGTALANAATLLNLSVLVLGGTVLKGNPGLERAMRATLRERVLEVSREALLVVQDELGERAGVLGAAALCFQGHRQPGLTQPESIR